MIKVIGPIELTDNPAVEKPDAKTIWVKCNIIGTIEFEGQEYTFEEPVEIFAYRSLAE